MTEARRILRILHALLLAPSLSLAAGACGDAGAPRQPAGTADWAVEDGFSLRIDTEGYRFPSAIAFVPEPGPGPKDPLYFVTELRGTVRVVTNDRTVHTFATDVLSSPPRKELPDIEGETGMAGICLEPKRGYVFVTFAYLDAAGVLRNNIVRLESSPGTFGTKAGSRVAFTGIFSGFETAVSHQIGGCQVSGDLLYVSVADGRKAAQSQQVNSVLGKVLRMTLDGRPAPGNPFREGDDTASAANYVWAYGFRNPFGLRIVDGRVFVAENGSGIDRFMEVEAGRNYLWNGSDWSIGTNAAVVLPVVGPVQVDYYAGGAVLPGRYAGSYFIALSAPSAAGVLALPYSLAHRRMAAVPSHFVRYVGEGLQTVVGVALGPDGLYFVPILPDRAGRSAVYRVAYDPDRPHPVVVDRDPAVLAAEHGCAGCHSIDGAGGASAPALERGGMTAGWRSRLESGGYAERLDQVDRLDQEPYRAFRAARAEIRRAEGDARVRLWLTYRLMEPRFDDPGAQMPNLGLTRAEAATLAGWLMEADGPPEPDGILARTRAAVVARLPARAGPRELVVFWGAGLLMGAAGIAVLLWLRRAPWR